ncbi:hypothetical protein B0H14DRAFT_3532752 [Mycena olivaceomarginata]|nr:hypothetical protein B0H14DRAFT_3532752 [Mycena olivaceomarginata]
MARLSLSSHTLRAPSAARRPRSLWKTRGVVRFTRPPVLPRLVSQPLAQAAERRASGSSHTHELAIKRCNGVEPSPSREIHPWNLLFLEDIFIACLPTQHYAVLSPAPAPLLLCRVCRF